jgi:hypothetical protein
VNPKRQRLAGWQAGRGAEVIDLGSDVSTANRSRAANPRKGDCVEPLPRDVAKRALREAHTALAGARAALDAVLGPTFGRAMVAARRSLPGLRRARAAIDARPVRGAAHVWVPRGLGNAGLLLAVVLDGDHWPDAATFTARRLGCSDDSVRRQTRELVGLGLVEQRDGFLVATAAGRDRLRRCDPLPRRLLRPGVAGRTLAVLRAASVLYGETLGLRASRHGVRGDRERADLAGVHRETIGKARALLTSVGLATFSEVRRGRAVLVRGAAVTDAAGRPVGSHGRPLGESLRERVAATAAKRRATPAGTGRVTAAQTGRPIQCSTSTSPIHGAAPATDGWPFASRSDGCLEVHQAEPAGVALPFADPTRRHRRASVTAGDVLGELVPELGAAKADRAARAANSSERAAAELRRLAADPQTVPRLLRMPAPRAIVQVLEAAGVYDTAPRRRAGLAVQAARVLDPVRVLVLAFDVLLGRPASIGATLCSRLKRAIEGKPDLLTRCRAAWPIGQFLEVVARGNDAPARTIDAPRTEPSTPPARRQSATDGPRPISGASFDDMLRGMGLGDLARRVTA